MQDFDELYDMLSSDREDVRKIKEAYEKEISILLGRVRSYHIDIPDITSEYNMDTNFEDFKKDDSTLRFNVNIDAIEYKISLLQSYLNDLFVEKKFTAFKKDKEEKLEQHDYLRYLSDEDYRASQVAIWYDEFMR